MKKQLTFLYFLLTTVPLLPAAEHNALVLAQQSPQQKLFAAIDALDYDALTRALEDKTIEAHINDPLEDGASVLYATAKLFSYSLDDRSYVSAHRDYYQHCIKLLLAHKADPNQKYIHFKTFTETPTERLFYRFLSYPWQEKNNICIFNLLSLLKAYGGHIPIDQPYEFGCSTKDTIPFFTACNYLSATAVAHLLEWGADVNYQDCDGNTGLLILLNTGVRDAGDDDAREKALTITRMLLEYGADCNKQNYKLKKTPLMIACGRGFLRITELLLFSGATLQTKDEYGETALHQALFHHIILKTLLKHPEHSLIINAQDKNGRTPLIEKCILAGIFCTDPQAITTLLEKGADVTIKDNDGNTALHHCCASKSHRPELQKCVQLLLRKQSKEKDNPTP